MFAALLSSAPASYSGTTSYGYDYGQSASPQMNRSQLTQETSTRASGTFSYGYDGDTSGGPGNPTTFKGTASTFNADNQIASSGYGYDGNGNPTTYKGQPTSFDPENRLSDTGSTAYGYDGDGHQAVLQQTVHVGNVIATNLTYKLYDGDALVSQYSGGGLGPPCPARKAWGRTGWCRSTAAAPRPSTRSTSGGTWPRG